MSTKIMVDRLEGYRCTLCRSPRVNQLTRIHYGNYSYAVKCDKCGRLTPWAPTLSEVTEWAVYYG